MDTFRYSGDVSINYEADGHGAIPVVFIHGFAASLVTWHDLRRLFPKDLFQLFLLDLKGFGFSSKPRDDGYGIGDQADIVIAFINAQELRDVVLIGHSFGGSIALRAALKSARDHDKSLIGRLILLNCAAYPQRLPLLMRILRMPILSRILMSLCPARFVVWYTLKRVFRNREAITAERISRYAGCFSRRGMARALVRTVEQLVESAKGKSTNGYRGIRIPALIIWGKEDPVTGLWQAYRLLGEIEGSRLELLDRCGHNPHEEYPEKTYALISKFLGE